MQTNTTKSATATEPILAIDLGKYKSVVRVYRLAGVTPRKGNYCTLRHQPFGATSCLD